MSNGFIVIDTVSCQCKLLVGIERRWCCSPHNDNSHVREKRREKNSRNANIQHRTPWSLFDSRIFDIVLKCVAKCAAFG